MEQGQRDLVLAPNEYAFIQDATKGGINVYVGPHKTSLAGTDKPVVFDYIRKQFKTCSMEHSIKNFSIAPEGWYIVLKNPAIDNKNPREGNANSSMEINIGRKINIPGPTSFALWPGQMARVLQGHQLKSNQYLVVRVYDDEAARANWDSAILKAREEEEPEQLVSQVPKDLAIGKLYIIKGTSVSFYIPPTGVEVVQDGNGSYVRDAVTLERLEYCILLDENGEKRFVRGPDVVFPEPTEEFVVKNKVRKYRAIELNDNSGIYIKVIADYDGHKAGDELFITGKEQKLYYPRAEHAIIKYGDETVQFGMAIPEGEGRYTLNRSTGVIDLIAGPKVLLPDPREEVLVRRVLSDYQVNLWYPGNIEALTLNQTLRQQDQNGSGFVTTRGGDSRNDLQTLLGSLQANSSVYNAAVAGVGGDEFERRKTFTPTKALTLNSKYEGAISVGIWPGYAIQLVNKKGERNVVQGPKNVLLKYDEDLSVLSLSTGKPKTTDKLYETVYLKVKGNKIGDIINVETSDMVKCDVKISVRVNFEGDPNNWFDVDNYVKLLTDHIRSLLKERVKRLTIEEFYSDAITYIRDTVLGEKVEGEKRSLKFEENDMVIYDVEVLNVDVGNYEIKELLMDAQEAAVVDNLSLIRSQRKLELTKQLEEIKRIENEEIIKTAIESTEKTLELSKAKSKAELEKENAADLIKQFKEKAALGAAEAKRQLITKQEEAAKIASDARFAEAREALEQEKDRLVAETEAAKARGEAISPALVAALQAFSDKALVRELAESMGTLAIANGSSVTTEVQRLLNNTPLMDVIGDFALNALKVPINND